VNIMVHSWSTNWWDRLLTYIQTRIGIRNRVTALFFSILKKHGGRRFVEANLGKVQIFWNVGSILAPIKFGQPEMPARLWAGFNHLLMNCPWWQGSSGRARPPDPSSLPRVHEGIFDWSRVAATAPLPEAFPQHTPAMIRT